MNQNSDLDIYLKSTPILDFENELFADFVKDVNPNQEKKNIAIQLYFKVRDNALYDPYHLDLRPEKLVASSLINKKRAWCVEKAILLAAVVRKFNIPSRLGYAIVTNHIGVDKLYHYLKREEIVFHGYVELYLNNKWVKCTPAFDQRICKLANVSPLDWDGMTDSMFQAFEGDKKFMEYLHMYGDFEDVPISLMNEEMKKYYPHLFKTKYDTKAFSFFHI